jgi:hypothetical protein
MLSFLYRKTLNGRLTFYPDPSKPMPLGKRISGFYYCMDRVIKSIRRRVGTNDFTLTKDANQMEADR